jgi:hypothetical protein
MARTAGCVLGGALGVLMVLVLFVPVRADAAAPAAGVAAVELPAAG